MSSAVVVVYGTRQVKVKCNPGTLIREIKANACGVLNLNPDKYNLKHGKDILASSSPFRLCNIVSNAKLDLVPAKARPDQGIVKVRLQVIDLPPDFSAKLLADFPCTTTIWNILKSFEKTSGINFTQRKIKKTFKHDYYEVPTIQLFNKVLTRLEQLDETLQDLGIEDGTTSMRIRFEKTEISFEKAMEFVSKFRTSEASAKAASDAKADTVESMPNPRITQATTSTPAVQSPGPPNVAKETPFASTETPAAAVESQTKPTEPAEPQKITPETRKINVYTPATRTRVVGDHGPEEEMNLQQFSRYQNQLKAMSEPQPVLMTKAMREQAELEKRSKLTQCTIRVRLPDQSHIEATFNGSETTDALYDFVKSMLRKPDEKFVLFVTPPRKELATGLRLNVDCKFTSRELVFFEWKSPQNASIPVLKDEVLGKAKPISDTVGESETSGDSGSASGKAKKFSSKPKWMKLSKK